MKTALVIGAGPAGLMAAEVLAQAGLAVTLCEAKPSVGRKFLMAGKSGLNLTMDQPYEDFAAAFDDHRTALAPMLAAFDNVALQDWVRGLDQQIFTGSSGRVFPTAMKSSPLLRSWLSRLGALGVELRTRWRWVGFSNSDGAVFDTADGEQRIKVDVTVLAFGGASWARLGSDGGWATALAGVDITPFAPANVGATVAWSAHMQGQFGKPVKGVQWRAGRFASRGEAVITAAGLEGGGIYSVSRGLREGAPLFVDLLPDLTAQEIAQRLKRPQGKTSLSNYLRKVLRLDPAKLALLQEMGRPLPQGAALVSLLKDLPIKDASVMPLDGAISVAGGVAWDGVDETLMLRARPGVFVAGEMLDWEAPTGGYLLSGCLATGRWAGQGAAAWALDQASR